MEEILIAVAAGWVVGFFGAILLRKIRQKFDDRKAEKEYQEWREAMESLEIGESDSQIELSIDPFFDDDSYTVIDVDEIIRLGEEFKAESRKTKKSK